MKFRWWAPLSSVQCIFHRPIGWVKIKLNILKINGVTLTKFNACMAVDQLLQYSLDRASRNGTTTSTLCTIRFFFGGGGGAGVVTPLNTTPPINNFCLYVPPLLKCFWKDPLITLIPHHPTSSIFPCYPLPIHHPCPPYKF